MPYANVREFTRYTIKLMLEENVKNEIYSVSADILFTFHIFRFCISLTVYIFSQFHTILIIKSN